MVSRFGTVTAQVALEQGSSFLLRGVVLIHGEVKSMRNVSDVVVTNQVLFLQEEIHAAVAQMLEYFNFMMPHLGLMLSFVPRVVPQDFEPPAVGIL